MKINSAADNAYDSSDDAPGNANMNYPVHSDGAMPKINTANENVSDVPGLSGQTALPSVKTVDLPDSDEPKVKSAA